MITKPIIPLVIAIPLLLAVLICYIISAMRKKQRNLYRVLGILRIAIIIFLAFMINLRPMEKKFDAKVEMKNLDVLFVVDATISMWAEDYDGNDPRIDGVLADTEYIIDELSGSNFGLIKFDNRSQILAPFTQDHETVKDAIATIKEPDIYYAKGSSLNTPYDDIKALLESSDQKDERMTILFYISDGEITDDSQLMSFKELEDYVDAGAVLGYGTDEGGKMEYGSRGVHVQDPDTNSDAISRIDEDNLRSIASDLDIEYIHMTSTAKVQYLVESIKNGSSLTIEKSDSVSYEDTYFYYAIALIIMLILEVVLFIRRGKL